MIDLDQQFARIYEIIGGKDTPFEQARQRFYEHLCSALSVPCEVTGTEDFNWEEYYIFGPGDPKEHERLRKSQPSYMDMYDLLIIKDDLVSPWMLFRTEDLGAHVRRKSDGREFILGLAELEPTDRKSENYQLLADYSVWFVNFR